MLSPQSLLASGMAWTMADIRLVTTLEGGDPHCARRVTTRTDVGSAMVNARLRSGRTGKMCLVAQLLGQSFVFWRHRFPGHDGP